jgi:hypothetical protein
MVYEGKEGRAVPLAKPKLRVSPYKSYFKIMNRTEFFPARRKEGRKERKKASRRCQWFELMQKILSETEFFNFHCLPDL